MVDPRFFGHDGLFRFVVTVVGQQGFSRFDISGFAGQQGLGIFHVAGRKGFRLPEQ